MHCVSELALLTAGVPWVRGAAEKKGGCRRGECFSLRIGEGDGVGALQGCLFKKKE